MNPSEQDRLLQELLMGQEVAHLREASLARGLNLLMRRRRRRAAMRIAAGVMLPFLVVGGIFSKRIFSPTSRHVETIAAPPLTIPAANSSPRGAVQTITAEELFALLPHHSLALIGKPGHQELICLDQPAANTVDSDSTAQ